MYLPIKCSPQQCILPDGRTDHSPLQWRRNTGYGRWQKIAFGANQTAAEGLALYTTTNAMCIDARWLSRYNVCARLSGRALSWEKIYSTLQTWKPSSWTAHSTPASCKLHVGRVRVAEWPVCFDNAHTHTRPEGKRTDRIAVQGTVGMSPAFYFCFVVPCSQRTTEARAALCTACW